MSITKRYEVSRDSGQRVCRVTFVIDPKELGGCRTASVPGEFNEWGTDSTRMKRRRDGRLSASVKLPAGGSYEFRYLLDGTRWANDPDADEERPTKYPDACNSVVRV